MAKQTLIFLLLLVIGITACAKETAPPAVIQDSPTARPLTITATAPATATRDPVPMEEPTDTPRPTASAAPTASATLPPSATPSSTATATASATPTPSATATPDPYAGLTIKDLAARVYGGGALEIQDTLAANGVFTRTLVTYPSDGVTVYGFMNVPRGEGPFPVVVVNHGYVDPTGYSTLTYTTRYADALARAGYIAIHPNFRNYPPSDEGPNPFRIGYAVDVLNLVALIRDQAGQSGPLQKADPNNIGLWGHSMGGGVTLRAITVDPEIEAAVLYGSMSGDEKKNHEKILIWSGGQRGQEELNTPEEDLQRISPIYHLERIEAAVSVHHGEVDGTVPLEWSVDLCQQLEELGKAPECFTYPGQPHTFVGEGDQLFIQRIVAFFDRLLKTET
jgi:dienelactone hydrolase